MDSVQLANICIMILYCNTIIRYINTKVFRFPGYSPEMLFLRFFPVQKTDQKPELTPDCLRFQDNFRRS